MLSRLDHYWSNVYRQDYRPRLLAKTYNSICFFFKPKRDRDRDVCFWRITWHLKEILTFTLSIVFKASSFTYANVSLRFLRLNIADIVPLTNWDKHKSIDIWNNQVLKK